MSTHFELQPAEGELQNLAEEYWQKSCNRERQLEMEAYEAGAAIRGGEYTLANLEAIVRWKSERLVHYLIGNGGLRIQRALEVAASPEADTEQAMKALLELHGVDVSMASSILAVIFPDRYIELNIEDLEALGQRRQDIKFYEDYLDYCRGVAERAVVHPHEDVPGATPLQMLDRALAQWARNHAV
jgi:hypothetical protein